MAPNQAENLTLEVALERAREGLMSPGELTCLYEKVRLNDGPGAIVEVGSFRGTSALVIVAGCHAAGRKDCIYCIDTFQKGTRVAFDRNLEPYIRSGEVTVFSGRSADVLRNWPKDRRIKLLFLDSDHTYGSTRQEILTFLPLLADGATVIFHDCFYRAEPVKKITGVYFWNIGVSQAVREWVLEDPRFQGFETAETILVAKFRCNGGPPDSNLVDFRKEFDRRTSLHSLRLLGGYWLFLFVTSTKKILDFLGLGRAARFVLRKLGFRRLFKDV